MRRAALTVVAALALALAAPALAQAPPPARVTIVSVFNPIVVGESSYINGQLIGDEQAGATVMLQVNPFPYTVWADAETAVTDFRGYYTFKLKPETSTHYRTIAQGVMSEREAEVNVAPRVKLAAARAGTKRLRFSGTIAPAHVGTTIAIQRQTRSGAWTTIASPRLRAGGRFEGRLRARSELVLRAFFATDGDHLDGFSNAVRINPA
jgi:hypothetical protein